MTASHPSDPYWKLRPPAPTPEDEICHCVDKPPIALQDHLSSIPLACLRCNGEVPPERLGFDEDLAERIAFWRDLHRALYRLWLDSGEHENWARDRLLDPEGRVNRRGLEIVQALSAHRRTYYWWFEDVSYETCALLDNPDRHWTCPRCSGELMERTGCLVCEGCSILVHRLD
jgi:hypothetical protein